MWLADMFRSSPGRRFFDLLDAQASVLLEAARDLAAFVAGGRPELATVVDELEHKGDALLVQLVDAIADTFVTPLDRQDLYNLGEALDDMLDYIASAAVEIALFKQPGTPAMSAMCSVLVEAAASVREAVEAISHDHKAARRAAREACSAENRMEVLYRTTLAELFQGDDIRAMLKLREIYRHLSNSADRADAVGKLIGKIVVKTS
jgi:uncharacterized protein